MVQVDTILYCFTLFICQVFSKFPTQFKKCAQGDKECITSAVQNALFIMKDGLPELGIMPLDPLVIPSLQIGAGNGPVNVVQNYKDVKVHGYSTTKVQNVDFDLDNNQLHVEFLFSIAQLEGQYELNGKVLMLPVSGKGHSDLKLYDLFANNTMTLEKYEKNGKEYVKIIKSDVKFNPSKASYLFENLFNGDKKLGDQINFVINDNWKEIFDDVKEGYEQTFAAINMGVGNQFFSKIPISELFL